MKRDGYRSGVSGIRTMFVIGRDGKLFGSIVGAGEAAHEQLLRSSSRRAGS